MHIPSVEGLQIDPVVPRGPAGAVFSTDRKYRYLLWRMWAVQGQLENGSSGLWRDDGKFIKTPRWMLVAGLNPSKADEKRSDPTVSQMRGRAQRMGFDGLLMVNAHALVSTDPLGMKAEADPTGPDNMLWIGRAAGLAEFILCAWGNMAGTQGAVLEKVFRKIGKPVHVLGLTKEWNPRHPRGVSLTVQPREWK